jgi:signal transduction histidine kinase
MRRPSSRTLNGLLAVLSAGLLAVIARLSAAVSTRRHEAKRADAAQPADLESLIEERTRELSALSTHLQALAETEKSELARNLHDELGGLLTAAKMDLSWLQGRVVDQPAVQQRLQQLGSVLDEAMDVKRRVVEALRPSLLDHFGLPTALRAYVESSCAKAGLKCELVVAERETVPKDVAITLFRVVQEGLTNVVRHAQAHGVRLALDSDERCHLLELSDDGRGIELADATFRGSHGLAGMRHRVRGLGGQLSISSRRGHGTTLRVQVPKRHTEASG